MKVLLCSDVKKIGYYGDVVDVADGFARNYLFPQGLAKVATDENIRSVADEKARRSEDRLRERKRLEAAAAAVNGAEAAVSAKANEVGHLFGSVGPKEIAENLRSQGFDTIVFVNSTNRALAGPRAESWTELEHLVLHRFRDWQVNSKRL